MKIKKLLRKFTVNSIDDNCYYNAEDMIDFAKYVLKEKLTLTDVVASLPEPKEIESRLNHVVNESFEDNEVVEKREYSLGFRACYNWLKIKQMKSKG